MPGTALFGVNSDGRVYVLSTSGSRWHELDYLGIEFKHVSAVPNCVWAVGGDRQVYVHVHGLDIPIRVKEESYENQRWLPLDGFSARLLPTDRFHFSSQDGTIDRSWDLVELPSRAWAWESDWHIETVMDDGQPLDHEGWTYAIDFPASYGPQKQWKSCVRRRKWVRYRRYVALNSWCALPPLHRDPTQEPFIDVSVGGHQISSCEMGTVVVWAITVQGRVLFRKGLSAISPEGSQWICIPLPPRSEPAQLCVGPSGHVWCVLWDGRVLVRDLFSRDQLQGGAWLEVAPPEHEGVVRRLRQVGVGSNVVWAVASDGSVWFRRSVNIPDRPAGNGWVHMVGEMAQVSVGSDNQVWAVGAEDRCIYFRTGVVPEELTGRTWKKVLAGGPRARGGLDSVSSSTSSSGINICAPSPSKHHVHHLGTSATVERPGNSFFAHHVSQPSAAELGVNQIVGSLDNLTIQDDQAADISALLAGGIQDDSARSSLPNHYMGEPRQLRSLRDGSRSLGQLEGRVNSGDSNSETDSVFGEDDDTFMGNFSLRLVPESDEMCQLVWNWVAAGACTLDPLQPPNSWFTDMNQSRSQNILEEPWRTQIVDELKQRKSKEYSGFDSYEYAIELASWIKTGRAKFMLPRGGSYDECLVEVEWVTSGGMGSAGTLTILSPDRSATKVQMSLSELSVAMVTSEPGLPRLSLHECRTGARSTLAKGQHPLTRPCMQLVFSAEKDMEDWLGNLNTVCCELQGISKAPGAGSVWATTALGDIFVWDPATMYRHQLSESKDAVFRQELASCPQSVPCEAHLSNAFPVGSAVQIRGRVLDKSDRFAINLQSWWGHTSDASKYIAFHFNPRLKDDCVVRNSMEAGDWGDEEREGNSPFERGAEFCLRIECHAGFFKITVDGVEFTTFSHRLRPEDMSFLAISGDISISSILYESHKLALAPGEMFWRQVGGHLRRVETCSQGVVWGLGFDGRAWVYTGGWGGGCLGASDNNSSTGSLHTMTDTQSCYIYENQRWNPVTGYSARGLPTDRPPWSDKSGKHKRSKDKTRLRTMHWQWTTEWRVDFHTPGGVDRDGWQYAVDFPASYHGRKKFTDYVRRRRWERRCAITTSGPWLELGGSKLVDVSLMSNGKTVTVWAVALNGDALYRQGVTVDNPQGENWQHVSGEHPLCAISIGNENKLWAVGKNGSAFWRFGITPSNPTGEAWVLVDPPAPLQQISSGKEVWALDKEGKVYLRREVTAVFPEGTHWLMTTDLPEFGNKEVRQISCGFGGLWAVIGSGEEPGIMGLRCGVSEKCSSGVSWNCGTSTGWQHLSVRGWN